MCVTPTSGSTSWGRPAASRADENCSVCAATTLSSARPWISSSGRVSSAASGRGTRVVAVPLVGRVAQVALGVVRVVQTPLRHGRAGDGGMEHIRPAQHGERGEEAAEAPTPDGHPIEVEHAAEALRGRMQRSDLVVERGRGQIEMDGALPLGSSTRCSAPVGHHHGETLIGEPLSRGKGVRRTLDAQGVRAPVRVEQDRER